MNSHAKISAQKKKFGFEYERLCLLQNTCPVGQVVANLKDEILDVNADRIHLNEWNAILGALHVNNSLKYIGVKSYWQPLTNEKQKKMNQKKTPVIRSREMTLRLLKSLKDCLYNSEYLQFVELQNIPLREIDITYLSKGITRSRSLNHLSLQNSRINDETFEGLCKCIKKSQTLISLNVSSCGLTWKSAELVAMIIKFQATQRHGEAWQESLRYRRPDLDQMHGLRRITLNDNRIGDNGARILADALKDDLWLKALDLQQCGISSEGAQLLQDALLYNKAVYVLDLRRNKQVGNDLLRSIIEKVMINAGGENLEFRWMSNTDEKEKTNNRRHRFNASKRYGGKIDKKRELVHKHSSEHYPWRTEERKTSRLKTKNPLNQTYTEPRTALQVYNKTLPSREHSLKQNTNIHNNEEEIFLEELDDGEVVTEKENSNLNNTEHNSSTNMLLEELQFYKDNFEEEQQRRLAAERKLTFLENENQRLQETLKKYESEKKNIKENDVKVNTSKQDKQALTQLPTGILEDEKVLESIETSFQQFQQFLDMLKNLGLGDLYNQMQQQQKE